ncbi:hypothetical protein WJX74_011076 [Apatococcus lobatus]|uniref:Uncharacterized protein n=1 Tax=Apatococcus lobatus TaxID=904363 RepID=A0AAW1S7Y9_9CHLO
MQEAKGSADQEAPRELLRGPPPVTTGRPPITTGAKLPSSYGHTTSRVLHNPRPICTVFPSVHSVQVRQAANSGAPALTLTSAPAIRGTFPTSSSLGESSSSYSIQPSGSSPHHPQAINASKQLLDTHHVSSASPRYSSPVSGHSLSAIPGQSKYQASQVPAPEMPAQLRSMHTRSLPLPDANEQPAYPGAKQNSYQPSLIEEYSSMSPHFGAQQPPLQLSARDLEPNLEAAHAGSASHKPFSSSMHQHQIAAGRNNNFSLRVGRICEDSAEGQDVAIIQEPQAQASLLPLPKMPPANWLLESNCDHTQASPLQSTGQSAQFGQANGCSQMVQQARQHGRGPGPEILQDLDPPLPGMARHPSNPNPAASSQPLMDKSKSMPVMYPVADYATIASQQWQAASGSVPEGWLQGPSGVLGGTPPEPGMLSDPPLPFAAEVPRSDAPQPPPNPFAMPQPQLNGPDGFGPSMSLGAIQPQPMHAPHKRRAGQPSISGRSDPGVASAAASLSPRYSTPFENSWHLGPNPQPMEFAATANPRGSYVQLVQQDRSSHSSWDPSKQPSGTLTHLSHPSHADLSSYVSSQTDNLADGPGLYLPTQDSNGPATSISAMYPYTYGDTWGKRSGVSSAQQTNGPLEPDFWQPIDVEAETARTDDASEPWTASLEGTSSMQLADLYTWLDNALESRPEDPMQPNAPDAAAAPSRATENPHTGSVPLHMNGSLNGSCSELDEPGRSAQPAAGSKHRTLLLGEPQQRSRRRLSIETNPFSVSGDEEIIAVPKSEMQAKEIEQQRLQQQVEEKQQACEILAMQLVDAKRRCQTPEGFPAQHMQLPQQADLLAPPG